MIEEFKRVRIKTTGITGIIIDISEAKGRNNYIVESDEKGVPGGYGSVEGWKLFDCEENELEIID